MIKEDARILAKNIRKKLDTKTISNLIVKDIISSGIIGDYKIIGLYYPLRYEIDLLELRNYYNDKIFCFPKTTDVIEFYKDNGKFVKAKFNIMEPISNEHLIPELIFVPCLGLNYNNARLGYGKGFYDRYAKVHSSRLVGVCYKKCVFDFAESSNDIKFATIFKE